MWWNLNYLGETSTMNSLSESDIIIIVAKEMLVSLATMVVFKVATLFLRNVVNEMAVFFGDDVHVYTCKINQLPVLCPSIPGDREHFRYISAPGASVRVHGTSKVNYNGLIINSLSELPA